MKEKNGHSRGSENPVLNLFNIQTSWMPAFAGMTNYDAAYQGGGEIAIGRVSFQ
jgi:formyltetrahydrofolate hydrolase